MSKKNKKVSVAEKQQQQAMEMSLIDREATRAKATELDSTRNTRLGSFINLRDKSKNFLNDVESGKDIAGLMSGELGFRKDAADKAKAESRYAMNTGSRKLAGSPNENFMAQLNTVADTERENAYAGDALGLLNQNMGMAKNDMLSSESVLNNDEYQVANVLSGNSAQGMQFAGAANQNLDQTQARNRGWFSKYVMPFAQGAAGAASTWLTGGMK